MPAEESIAVKLIDGQISKNKGKYGGGVTAAFNSKFIMEGTGVISENEAYTGGGFYPWGTTPSCDLISGTIEKNKANFGGGLRSQKSVVWSFKRTSQTTAAVFTPVYLRTIPLPSTESNYITTKRYPVAAYI